MPFELFSPINAKERLFLTKHLATMIKAGIPLSEALITIRDQAKHPAARQILTQIAHDTSAGMSFSQALKKYPHIFDTFYVHLIEVSEASGTLDSNLEYLALQLSKDFALKQKVQAAMLYPSLVLVATVVMGGFVALFILPQLVEFFSSFEVDLPLTTRILLGVAVFMRDYGLWFAAGAFFSFTGLTLLIQTAQIKPLWHQFQLRLPLFGSFTRFGQLSLFCRNLGILMKSGVPIARALQVTALTLSNLQFRSELQEVEKRLVQGQHISQALVGISSQIYPELVIKMIAVGEKTGRLDETLIYLADFYEDELDNLAKNISTSLEPILLLVIGLVVGFVAVAVISPIYELTSSIGQ